jgi:hypothetical protein
MYALLPVPSDPLFISLTLTFIYHVAVRNSSYHLLPPIISSAKQNVSG